MSVVKVTNPTVYDIKTKTTRGMTNEEFDENLEMLFGNTTGSMSVHGRRSDGTFGGYLGDRIYVGIRIKSDRKEFMEFSTGATPRLTGASFSWDASREMYIASRRFNWGDTYSLTGLRVDYENPTEILTETRTEEIPKPKTVYIDNENMVIGEEKTISAGRVGEYLITEKVTYYLGEEVDREEVKREVTTEAKADVVERGTYDGPVETIVIHPERPIQIDNVVYIPYDERLIYKDVQTGEILYEDIDVVGGLIIQAEVAPGAPVSLKYELRGETRWEFQSKLEATGGVPVRRGNQIAIPEVEGRVFFNASTFEILTGVVEFKDTIIITHNGEFTEHFVFEEQEAIYLEAPEEHERHVVIPLIDGVEFFDDYNGELLQAGERLIGERLTVRARLKDESKYYIFNQASSWTYIRPGGIKAPSPDAFDTFADIPNVTTVEYYDADTGEVFRPGQTINARDSATGKRTIRVRAKGDMFLTNPYAQWEIGRFDRGLITNLVIWELNDSGFSKGWRRVTSDEEMFEYVDIYVNGDLMTDPYMDLPPVGEFEVSVELKERPGTEYQLDWSRDREGIPRSQEITLSAPFDPDDKMASFIRVPLEHVGYDVLKGTGVVKDNNYRMDINLDVREVKETPDESVVVMKSYQAAMFNTRDPVGGDYGGQALRIKRVDIGKYVKVYVDDKELTKDDFATHLDFVDGFAYAQYDTVPIDTGYRKIRLSLRGTELGLDFRWTMKDETAIRYNTLWLSGGDNSGVHTFESDENGDLVWEGPIPRGTRKVHLDVAIFTSEPAEFGTVDGIWGPRIEPPWYNTNNRSIWIKEDFDHMVEYADYDEKYKVYEPGIHFIDRDTRIYPRYKRRFGKHGGRYILYNIHTLGWIWTYEWFGDNEFLITAEKPIQSGHWVTIPEDDNVYYYDIYEREIVSGTIDLRTRRDGRMVIQPYPGWWNYELSNKGIRWTFTETNFVYSIKPKQEENTIIIPDAFGVEYYNKITGNVLRDRVRIISDITISARAIDDYILGSEVNEWTFTPMEGSIRNIIAVAPTIAGNWVSIPVINGIAYYDVDTGTELEGSVYVDDSITIGVRATDTDVNLINKDDTWEFNHTPVETSYDKEIYITKSDPNVTIRVNGTTISGRVFVVDIRGINTIEVLSRSGASLNSEAYLLDTEGNKQLFNMDGDSRSYLEVDFEDTDPIELFTGTTDIKYQSVLFVGINATLEVRNLTTKINELIYPGQTTNLIRRDDYEFVVRADEDHIFERNGSATYSGNTTNLLLINETTASYKVLNVVNNVVITMDAYKVEPETPTDAIGFNNLYLVDKETLSEISREFLVRKRQFMVSPAGAGGLNYDSQLMTDPHTYIINTIQLPFAIEDADIANRSRVRLGFTELRPSAPRLNKDKLTLDLGTIRVKPKYNNAYDYKNTHIMLHLPYTNTVMVEPNYVIGETVTIEYLVDAYTGHTTINLRSSLVDGNVFHTVETYIGNEIPFISMKDGSTVGSTGETRSLINNNTPRPYVEVVRNVPHQMDSIFNRDVTESVDQLGSVSGRVYVHNISLDLDATTAEVSTIKSILSGGITIK